MHTAMMAGSSSSAQRVGAPRFGKRTGLPLVPCPTCGEEIMELTSAAGSKVPGAIFFKCRLHERDIPGTCPWYLFADKYEKLLIARGVVQRRGVADACIRPEDSLAKVEQIEQIKIGMGRIEGVSEANNTELTPLLDYALKNESDRVVEKLQKLVDLGKIVSVCLVVVALFVVLGVIIMFFK